ncbi:hypothetical protein GCM10009799_31020 [Nocardiopsis rhodophaea]|uniref:Uncharacterized protein n=1 Tax=Nocardiopsis rhodophaea TaxID=280238 RepID=A0ABN2T8E1_9ACTN
MYTRSDTGAGFVECGAVVLTIDAIVIAILATGFDRTPNQIVATIKDSICEAFKFIGLETECHFRLQLEALWTAVTWQTAVSPTVYFMTASVSAIVHRPREGRLSTSRSAQACLAIPVAGTLVYLVNNLVFTGVASGAVAGGLMAWNAAALAGALLGWQPIRTMRT